MTDFEQFKRNTFKYVKDAVPDASVVKQRSAANEIIKKFKWMFTKKGNYKQIFKDKGMKNKEKVND